MPCTGYMTRTQRPQAEIGRCVNKDDRSLQLLPSEHGRLSDGGACPR
jgi:hypothetical protein